jgi:hypothetical protein
MQWWYRGARSIILTVFRKGQFLFFCAVDAFQTASRIYQIWLRTDGVVGSTKTFRVGCDTA